MASGSSTSATSTCLNRRQLAPLDYTLAMLSELQLLGLGAATVIDTVLLVALIERPNRRQVALWMLVLTAAGWLWLHPSFNLSNNWGAFCGSRG